MSVTRGFKSNIIGIIQTVAITEHLCSEISWMLSQISLIFSPTPVNVTLYISPPQMHTRKHTSSIMVSSLIFLAYPHLFALDLFFVRFSWRCIDKPQQEDMRAFCITYVIQITLCCTLWVMWSYVMHEWYSIASHFTS